MEPRTKPPSRKATSFAQLAHFDPENRQTQLYDSRGSVPLWLSRTAKYSTTSTRLCPLRRKNPNFQAASITESLRFPSILACSASRTQQENAAFPPSRCLHSTPVPFVVEGLVRRPRFPLWNLVHTSGFFLERGGGSLVLGLDLRS
ncbi:uncharacterized protein BJX67DRAFT_363050 [Aspergillus lucknowensis]|uniref:Uncharacterized protein n=1 Tax=Aspergillus lucknowensis TaxID=176173 RepID=A0ABR4LGE2_9EURO